MELCNLMYFHDSCCSGFAPTWLDALIVSRFVYKSQLNAMIWYVMYKACRSLLTCMDSPLRDAALRTGMWRPPGVVVAERGKDTPSEDDYMGGKLKTWSCDIPVTSQPIAPSLCFSWCADALERHKPVPSSKHATYLRGTWWDNVYNRPLG